MSAKSLMMVITMLVLVAGALAYSVQEPSEEDYYTMALANLLRQRQAMIAGQGQAAQAQGADKRGCMKRGAGCLAGSSDCCEGSACRCNLFGSNCRCQRQGFLQKLI